MSLTTVASLLSAATHTVGKLMVLAPQTSTLPKLLLKPGRWTVGSAATCSYQVAAEGVRPRHALLLCGKQTTVLKAWDTHTWHNDQPVNGEVRLQLGDRLTIGSVQFSIELPGTFDVVGLLPDVPPVATGLPHLSLDATDLERFREQIHELRDDLTQQMSRQNEAVSVAPVTEPLSQPEPDTTNARIAELEQSVADARHLAEQAQQTLTETRAESERREAELRHAIDELRSSLDTVQNEVAELHHERDTLRSEAAQREQTWQHQTAEWSDERERLQQELLSLAAARHQLATEAEQRQSTLAAEATRWQTDSDQLRAESLQQQTAWEHERARLQDDLLRLGEAHQHTSQLASNLASDHERAFAERSQQDLADRQQWDAERDQLRTERDQLQTERDQLQTEHNQLRNGLEQRPLEFDQLQVERDQLRTERGQLQTERDQLRAERDELWADNERLRTSHDQQLQAEWSEREQAIAALNSERQRIDQQAAEVAAQADDVAAKVADFSQRLAQFEQQQIDLTREKQTLEHSWNWLHSDRRKLVEEKNEWQQQRAQWQAERESWTADSEQLATDRQQLLAEQSTWSSQHDQFDAECRVTTDELAVVRAELNTQQQSLLDEQTRLDDLRAELNARAAELEQDREGLIADRLARQDDAARKVIDSDSSRLAVGAAIDEKLAHDGPIEATSPSQLWTAESSSNAVTPADPWNIGVDLTAPRETLAADWPASEKLEAESMKSSWPATLDDADLPPNSETVEARPAKFLAGGTLDSTDSNASGLPGSSWDLAITTPKEALTLLEEPTSIEAPTSSTIDSKPDHTLDAKVDKLRELLAAPKTEFETALPPGDSAVAATSAEESPAADQTPMIVPNSGPVLSVLESMAFSDDEDVDDSVSRYMQHLLARSQNPGEANSRDRYVPVHSLRATATPSNQTDSAAGNATLSDEPAIEVPKVEQLPLPEANSVAPENLESIRTPRAPTQLTQLQNKDAVRAATEQMRQVANQQTLSNVEAASWKDLKRAMKNKMILATLSFLLSAGLIYCGYEFQPKFLLLGGCAAGLGVMTWLDLILDIRKARARMSKLSGRSKKPDDTQS